MLRDADGDHATCTLARILQGVNSPGIGLDFWARKPYWGKYGDVDFAVLTAAIERARGASAAAVAAAVAAARVRKRARSEEGVAGGAREACAADGDAAAGVD